MDLKEAIVEAIAFVLLVVLFAGGIVLGLVFSILVALRWIWRKIFK